MICVAAIAMLIIGTTSMRADDSRDIATILAELDGEIARKDEYKNIRVERIDSIKARLPKSWGKRQYELYAELFALYAHFNADSALHYNDLLASTEYVEQNPALHNEVLINLAEALGVMGMYSDALSKLDNVNAAALDRSTKTRYFQILRGNYGWLTDFTTEPGLKQKYRHLTDVYRDSILATQPPGVGYEIVKADRANMHGHPEEALAIIRAVADRADREQKSYVYYIMAEAYRIQGDRDNEIKYLALTAISDLRSGVKEYVALSRLAMLMFEGGHVSRAYTYLFCAMEDAAESKAGLRSIESSRVFPIIDKAYKEQEHTTRTLYRIFAVIVSVLAIALLVVVVFMYRQTKKLAAARTKLAQYNDRLSITNDKLTMTGKIKEAYITRYLHRCRSYLDEMDEYRRNLLKLARASRIDELNKLLRSDSYIKEENHKFYREFDETFVRLFPDFVEKFNALLLPEERIELKKEEMLTTELRIFALIRLGVNDSRQIAHFMGNSLTTIYNYRSKMRSKALCDKNEFEQRVMEIP